MSIAVACFLLAKEVHPYQERVPSPNRRRNERANRQGKEPFLVADTRAPAPTLPRLYMLGRPSSILAELPARWNPAAIVRVLSIDLPRPVGNSVPAFSNIIIGLLIAPASVEDVRGQNNNTNAPSRACVSLSMSVPTPVHAPSPKLDS